MRVRCISELPDPAQAARVPRLFRGGRQEFGVTEGATYIVFGIRVTDGVVLVDIAPEFDQLVPVPLFLFEVVDPRVSRSWEVRTLNDQTVFVWPASFFGRESYHEDLLEEVPEVVADFRRVREFLEREFPDN